MLRKKHLSGFQQVFLLEEDSESYCEIERKEGFLYMGVNVEVIQYEHFPRLLFFLIRY